MDNLSSYCASEGYRIKRHPSSSDKKQKSNYATALPSPAMFCACSYQCGRRRRQDGFDEELL